MGFHLPSFLQHPTFRNPLAISLGAVAGSLGRYYLTIGLKHLLGSSFPYGTFFVNITGCFGMGFLTTLVIERMTNISPEVQLLLAVGFLGSYTTFSTYELDTLTLLRSQGLNISLLYWLTSAILGFLSLQLGVSFAKLFR